MSILKYTEIIYKLDNLISTKRTGNPKELAEKLNTTEWTIYNYIRQMKQLGAPIVYSKQLRSYKYQTRGRFYIRFEKENPDRILSQ